MVMATRAAVMRRMLRLETTRRQAPSRNLLLDSLAKDPSQVLTRAGMTGDAWQTTLLRSPYSRTLLLASRQSGKSQTASAIALRSALLQAGALVLLLSPTLRQSGELFRQKLLPLWRLLGRPLFWKKPTQLELELSNGSRIVSLPESEEGIRGFSAVNLLVIDEASRVSDDLYRAVRPMLAVSKGRLIALTTPFGKRGWFYEEWVSARAWNRVKVTAEQCPRISPEFLAEERAALGERWYAQEYLVSFEDVVGSLFRQEDIDAMLSDDVPALTIPGVSA